MKTKPLIKSVLVISFLVANKGFAQEYKSNISNNVDVLTVYSKELNKIYSEPKTKINHLIATANKIYENSGLHIHLNLTDAKEIDISQDKNTRYTLSKIRRDKNINALRDKTGSDIVVIYRPYYKPDHLCGLAYVGNRIMKTDDRDVSQKDIDIMSKFAYAHVVPDCPAYVTAHEIGHIMGLVHSHRQDNNPNVPYAMGHGVDNEFTTVMAYNSAYKGAVEKIYKFSSPKLDCKGLPCGVEEGLEDQADAVKAICKSIPYVSKFKKHKKTNNATQEVNSTNTYKVYTEQLENYKKTLLLLKEDRDKKLTLWKGFVEEARALRKNYYSDRDKLLSLLSLYRKNKKILSNMHNKYKKQEISKEELLSQEAKTKKSKKIAFAELREFVKIVRPLRDFYRNKLQPSKEDFIKAQDKYISFYNNQYSPLVKKVETLKSKIEK